MNSDSVMREVTIEFDIDFVYMWHGGIGDAVVLITTPNLQLPLSVKYWLKTTILKQFEVTEEEEKEMPYSVTRTMGFEVEVFTKVVDNKEIAYKAECHTICPSFVAAWVEVEAMKQYNQKEKECTSLSSPSIPQ